MTPLPNGLPLGKSAEFGMHALMKIHIVWACIAVGALLFGTRLVKPDVQTKEVVVEKPVEVIKEVPKEIEKIVERRVEVPADIPDEYKTALAFVEKLAETKPVSDRDVLAGVESVSVSVSVSDEVKKLLDESRIRTKFEITLRRSGIPIDEKSRFILVYSTEGFTSDSPILTYSCRTSLNEILFPFRQGVPAFRKYVETWGRGNYGTVGTGKAAESLTANAERAAEGFANEWLAANPKK